MIPCLILGDSIAQGVAQQLPLCNSHAIKGVASAAFLRGWRPPQEPVDLAVISLGSNDDPPKHLADNLTALRREFSVARVVWIIPAIGAERQKAVRSVATVFGDSVIELQGRHLTRDGVHPTGPEYKRIALDVKGDQP